MATILSRPQCVNTKRGIDVFLQPRLMAFVSGVQLCKAEAQMLQTV